MMRVQLGRGLGQRNLPGAGDGDPRKGAKANDVAEEPATGDMFSRAGVAAE